MSRKTVYSFGLYILFALILFFVVQHRTGRSVMGTYNEAARENRLLPLREIQSFVIYKIFTERVDIAEHLLPDSLKRDPWGTPYECFYKNERFCLHSAGPDKQLMSRPLRPCDDILIFKSCVVDLSIPLSELDAMMTRFSEPLIAEALLNCDEAEYRSSASNWLQSHGYSTSLPGMIGQEVW
jgi:hypothetical protein